MRLLELLRRQLRHNETAPEESIGITTKWLAHRHMHEADSGAAPVEAGVEDRGRVGPQEVEVDGDDSSHCNLF